MIKIFISSTFSDMQSERDIIRKKVLPQLRSFSRKMGQDVSIVDLRWGISSDAMDSDEAMSKILSVCAEEIDSCQPYFVLLLGNRYGTLPEENPLNSFLRKHSEISSDMVRNKSITEIEAMLAMQKMSGSSKLIVCLRDSDLIDKIPPQHREAYSDAGEKANYLSTFKKNVTSGDNIDVISYHADWDMEKSMVCGLESFAEQLTESLMKQITNNIGEKKTSPEEEAEAFDNMLMENYLKEYVSRIEYTSDIVDFASGAEDVLVLNGASGIGKTHLLTKAAALLAETNEFKTIVLFLGNGIYDSCPESILTTLIYRLNKLVTTPIAIAENKALNELKSIANRLIKEVCKTQKLVIFIDNLSALQPEHRYHFFADIPLPQNGVAYKLIVSTNNAVPIATNALAEYSWRTLDVLGIDEEKMKQMISLLLSIEDKELDKKALDAFYNASLFRSPLYISLALNRLMMLSAVDFKKINELSLRENIDGGKALSEYLISLIENLPETEENLADSIIDELAEEIGIENHYLLIDTILIANEQLRAHDLVEIINTLTNKKITLLDLINFVRNAEGIFTINDLDGRIQFSHSLFKVHFEQNAVAEKVRLQEAIFNYIDGLDKDDPVRLRLYLPFSLYVGNYSKALSFVQSLDSHRTPNVYMELRPIFLSRNKCDEFIKLLNRLAEFAASQGAEELNAIASEYIGDIFHIANSATYGRTNADLQILEPLYRLMKENKAKATRDSEYNRTIYMVAEKCGISTTSLEDQLKYYGEFLNYCLEFYNSIDSSYEHRDYTISDLGYAYEKNASVRAIGNRWRDASELYDLAIKSVSEKVPPSTNKLDLLEYQRCSHIVSKYDMLMENFQTKKKMGLDVEEYLSEYCKNLVSELLGVVGFCKESLDSFIQSERSMVLASYIHLLAEANLVLSRYYNIIDDHISERPYLKKALECSYEHYRLRDDVLSYDKIRQIEYLLGCSESCSLDERLQYLQKVNQKTLELMQRVTDQNMIDNQKIFLDEIHGQILRLVFIKIHPKVDFESQEFLSDVGKALNKNGAEITDDNLDAIVSICNNYLVETKHSEYPSIPSYNSDYKKVVDAIYKGIYLTIWRTINCGNAKIREKYEVGYKYWQKGSRSLACRRLEEVWNKSQDLAQLTSRYVFRYIDKFYNMLFLYPPRGLIKHVEYSAGIIGVCKNDESNYKEELFWQAREMSMTVERALYRSLFEILEGRKMENEDGKDPFFSRFFIAFKDSRLFAFCIQKGGHILKKYLEFIKGKESKHEYYIFHELDREIERTGYARIRDDLEVIGKYLCDNVDDLEVKRILYKSIFFEDVALEYAYKNHRKDIAEKIIYNGYDHYLELGTLYIIRKYDRPLYYRIIDDLKLICLHRNSKITRENHYSMSGYRYIRNMHGDVFCDEFVKLAKKAMKKLKDADEDDPRLHHKRIIPDWAK